MKNASGRFGRHGGAGVRAPERAARVKSRFAKSGLRRYLPTLHRCWRRDKINVYCFPNDGGQTVSIIIEMAAQEIAALRRLTRLENDAEAVAAAAREFLRLNGLRELKAASGKVDFEANWQELENRELAESTLPE